MKTLSSIQRVCDSATKTINLRAETYVIKGIPQMAERKVVVVVFLSDSNQIYPKRPISHFHGSTFTPLYFLEQTHDDKRNDRVAASLKHPYDFYSPGFDNFISHLTWQHGSTIIINLAITLKSRRDNSFLL